jgi:hypothetical protein
MFEVGSVSSGQISYDWEMSLWILRGRIHDFATDISQRSADIQVVNIGIDYPSIFIRAKMGHFALLGVVKNLK